MICSLHHCVHKIPLDQVASRKVPLISGAVHQPVHNQNQSSFECFPYVCPEPVLVYLKVILGKFCMKSGRGGGGGGKKKIPFLYPEEPPPRIAGSLGTPPL
eukprot:COSAG06_NODE_19714_length_825_cov_1.800275_1_plen_100_part_10